MDPIFLIKYIMVEVFYKTYIETSEKIQSDKWSKIDWGLTRFPLSLSIILFLLYLSTISVHLVLETINSNDLISYIDNFVDDPNENTPNIYGTYLTDWVPCFVHESIFWDSN